MAESGITLAAQFCTCGIKYSQSGQVMFNQLKMFNQYLIHLKLNSFEKTKQNYFIVVCLKCHSLKH